MRKEYTTAEAIREIPVILQNDEGPGLTPNEILRCLQVKWPGEKSPAIRTVARHLERNPNIHKREPNVKGSPMFGRYYWVEPEPEPEPVVVPIGVQVPVPTGFMLELDEYELEELAESGVAWRLAQGFPDYEVGTNGQLRSWRQVKPRVLNPANGRANIRNADGQQMSVKIKTLVAQAFMVPRPAGCVLVHANGDRTDNSVFNLIWRDSQEFYLEQLTKIHEDARARTHCFRGHLLAGENLRRSSLGARVCGTCKKAYDAARARRRLQVKRGEEPTWTTEDILLERGQITFDALLSIM